MKKNEYLTPETDVIELKLEGALLAESDPTAGNAGDPIED